MIDVKKLESSKLTAYSTVALAVVTFALVLGMVYQTNLMQQEFDANQRPWIGITDILIVDNSIKVVYENFGNIPNNGGIKRGFSTTEIIPDRNYFFTGAGESKIPILFPSQKLEMNVRDLPLQDFNEIHAGQKILYIGFMFEYEYGQNKVGEYGVIGKFDPNTGLVDMIDIWAN